MTRETINGEPVGDDQVQAWAAEAETGYPVEQLRRTGRPALGTGPSTIVPVRLDPDLLRALAQRAEQEHVSRSDAIRAAIRAWLGAA